MQQHFVNGRRVREARGLRRRRAFDEDDEQARHVHGDAALDGARGDSGVALRRQGGRLGARYQRDGDGGGEPAEARRAPHARHLHDHRRTGARAARSGNMERLVQKFRLN